MVASGAADSPWRAEIGAFRMAPLALNGKSGDDAFPASHVREVVWADGQTCNVDDERSALHLSLYHHVTLRVMDNGLSSINFFSHCNAQVIRGRVGR